ncbi:MAG: Transcriptional regulatory protein GlrR [Planctomycetes bacterium]|nr:Transcriptional regulatory protein GlrR [Planctomycetota bacterium]
MTAPVRVLVVDDEPDLRQGLAMLLGQAGFAVRAAESGGAALAALDRESADLVLTDLQMPGMSGADLLVEVKRRAPSTVVVVLTGFGTIQTAVWCMQHGASHFLTKPFDNADLVALFQRLGRQVEAARQSLRAEGAEPLVAEDPRMQRVMDLVRRVAPTPVPVLIEGPTGAGKEVVARAIHDLSAAAARPFVAVNTGALPDTLLESELFGHVRGAFTGADSDRRGLFAEAQGGTVFLDEIASMSLPFQGKLLRVLQEKVVRPLGAARDVPVDFRLVSATNRDLAGMIRRGQFREDLWFRLRVVTIPVPPLRQRPGDVLPLAHRFLAKAARICLGPDAPVPELSKDAGDALLAHPWPGNVRELENTIQRAVVVCRGTRILPHHLGLGAVAWGEADDLEEPADYEESKRRAVERFQREFVQRALETAKGNVSQAAVTCGLTRAAFQRILRQLGIDRADFAGGEAAEPGAPDA